MITREEYGWLTIYRSEGFRWIARDKNKGLYVYTTEPEKREGEWKTTKSNSSANYIKEGYRFFPYVKWEDEKPTRIDDLIRDYESHQVITGGTNVNKAELIKEIEDILYNIGIHDYRIGERYEIASWRIDSKTIRKILSAIEKCSVEKEKLYTVRLANGDYLCRFKSVGIDWAKGQDYRNDKDFQLTQSEIESVDPILMQIAKVVE